MDNIGKWIMRLAVLAILAALFVSGCNALGGHTGNVTKLPTHTTTLPTKPRTEAPVASQGPSEADVVIKVVQAFRKACITRGEFYIKANDKVEHYECKLVEGAQDSGTKEKPF